jgi:ATP synthase protein I
MPRSTDQARRELWLGLGDAWTMVSELFAATVVWGAIGFGLDHWLGTGPVLMVIGALVGHGTGIYMVIRRANQMGRRAKKRNGENSG